ncbi:helix-turn-helix domain-containing protein [Paludisphaera rhizosphaerae]|uniref:helix-turn-helix domain-containing protein n=1 Tax=Paludisphaera rhizosphaerae TaxID=2711216 RepID=UPI0013ED15B8|nr:helix-turn-helix domain-containing protein [Paludisphaera rhizosphaerae]
MDENPNDLLTTAEVGAVINRATYMVAQYINWHGLPATRRSHRLYVRRSDLDAWRQRPDIAEMLRRGDAAKGVGPTPAERREAKSAAMLAEALGHPATASGA